MIPVMLIGCWQGGIESSHRRLMLRRIYSKLALICHLFSEPNSRVFWNLVLGTDVGCRGLHKIDSTLTRSRKLRGDFT